MNTRNQKNANSNKKIKATIAKSFFHTDCKLIPEIQNPDTKESGIFTLKNRAVNDDSPTTTAYAMRKELSLFKRDNNDLFY